jgi:Ca2+-binding EF-hand superfamily protein
MTPAEIQAILHDEEKLKHSAQIAFKSIDQDGNGSIDKAELFMALEFLSQHLPEFKHPTQKQIEEFFIKFDINKDGKLSFEEFEELVRAFLQHLLDLLK